MPTRPPKHKAFHRVAPRHISKEEREQEKLYNQSRPESDKRYNTARWQRLRLQKRKKNPLCELCLDNGTVKKMDVVDHIKTTRNYPELFFDMKNLRSLCHDCHAKHGARSATEKKEPLPNKKRFFAAG